jgi:sugar lactone lactonase YvrE
MLGGLGAAGPAAASNTASPYVISRYAGTGTAGTPTPGPATSSRLHIPVGDAADSNGNLYIADFSNNEIEKVTPGGTLSIIAGTGTLGTPTPGPATSSALNSPQDVAVDASGNVYISDSGNYEIEKVTPGGTLSIIAGTGTQGTPTPGPATSSPLRGPVGVAVDRAGDVFIADDNASQVEKVTPGGTLSIIAGTGSSGTPTPGPATSSRLLSPDGVAVDAAGNVFIADYGGSTVLKVTPDGTLSRFAGGTYGAPTNGPATSSDLADPGRLAVDAAGNLYIADYQDVEQVTPDGTLTVIAGNGSYGAPTYGGSATSSALEGGGVASTPAGRVYFADAYNQTIDLLAPPAPTSTVAPVVAGTTTSGQMLTADQGSWTGTPIIYAYQWQDCDSSGANCMDITGATASTYTLTSGDAGHTVRVVVTAQNGGGPAPADSATTAIIQAAPTTTTTTISTPTATTPGTTPTTPTQADAVTVPAATLSAGLQTTSEGQVSVPLQCPQVVAGVCDASGTLSIALNPDASTVAEVMSRAASSSDSVIASFVGVQVQAGQSRLVATKLTPAAIAYLRAHDIYRVRVTLEITNTLTGGQTVRSTQHTWLYVSGLTGCHAATGSVSSAGVGSLRLAMTRHGAHRTGHYHRTRNGFEHYCIAGGRVRVAYSSHALAHARHVRAGRVVVALTSNHHYAIHGVRAGTTVNTARKRLHLGRPIVIGKNAWYFIPGKNATRIVKAQHGVIREIGVTSRAAAHTRAQERYLLRHLK